MEKVLELYKYIDGVNDVPFPSNEEQLIIGDFKYDAKRMGGAPIITFNAMHRLCLDKLWDKNVYATFNGERYFIKQTPTSSYSNTDTRYKHDVELVSERVVLDNIYFYDVVTNNQDVDKPVSNSFKFTFFGDVDEYVSRLNSSLSWSGVNYNVVIDDGVTSEEKQVTFENQIITNALQEIYNIYKIPYYFVGKTIHIGEYQDNIDHVFKYGVDNSLLSISKNNSNAKIVNRITGVGSSDNIPYYYPNDDEKGVTRPLLNGSSNGVSIDNQSRYRKVRLSDTFVFHSSIQTQTPIIDSLNYRLGDLVLESVEDNKGKYSVDFYYSFTLNQHKNVLFNVSTDLEDSVDLRYEIYKTSGNHLGYFSESNQLSLTGGTYNFIIRWTFNSTEVMNGVREKIDSLIQSHLNISASIVVDANNSWTLKNIPVNLYSYGLKVNNPSDGDVISIEQVSYINTQPNLMPFIYRNSEGNERFYNAINNTYKDGGGNYYIFDNEYSKNHPSEYIENFDDIKPTIKNVTNAEGSRIDKFVDFAYDLYDNDEVDENNEYIHKYFFAKMNKLDGDLGFNLFDHSIDESEMVISMTSGSCGSCSFKIMVDKDTQKNTVQVDEYGNLLRDNNGNVRFGTPQDRQNDTENNEVWIALEKDATTFGVLMPNASNRYRPIAGDTFVILHIDLPKAYIVAAEKRLESKLIDFMHDNNFEKFNFSIVFSRIFFAENPSVLNNLNENAKIQVEYDGNEYSLFASSISISITSESSIPEIKVELSDNISISQNQISQIVESTKKDILSKTTKDVFWGDIKGVPSWIGSEKPRYSYSELSGKVDAPSEFWKLKSTEDGEFYIHTTYPVVAQQGVTMYSDSENLDLPSIYDGLPLDNDTIYWEEIKDEEGNVIDKRIKARGGSGDSNRFNYVIMSSELSFSEQAVLENTIYEIRYDFEGIGDVEIPANSVLLFNGGSVDGGTIKGNNTAINGLDRKMFGTSIKMTGTYVNSYLRTSWFGIERGTDVTETLSCALSNASSSGIKKLVVDNGSYYLSDTVNIPPRVDFGGTSNESLSAWKYTGEVPTFYLTEDVEAFSMGDGSNGMRLISVHDIAIRCMDGYSGSKSNMCGLYAGNSITMTGCTFRNIFIEGLRYGMYFNVTNGGGITENTFINVGLMRNTIGLFLDSTTTSNRAWFNHNYFRLCYFNENKCGGVYVQGIQSVQTILFQSCNFEQNGRDYNTSDYSTYGCFGFRAGSMLYGTVLFDSCYFEGTVPRSADNVNNIYSTVNYAKEAHVVFNAGQVEIRNSIIARTRQLVTVGSTGDVFLTNNEYYLTTRINNTFSTCLVRYLGVTGSGKTTSLVIKEPTLGNDTTYIDRPYEFNYTSFTSTNTFYQGNLDIEAPLFQREKTKLGVYEPETTFYIDSSKGNNDFNGLSKAHPFLNLSTFRYYGASRYGKIRRFTISLESDLSDSFASFGSSNPIKDTEILINGNGRTLTIKDKAAIQAYNVRIRFVNCNIVVDNQTAYYNTLYVSGKSELVFEGCTITFNTGKSTYFINGGAYGLLNVTFKNTNVTSLGTPSDLFLIRTREDSEVKVYSSGFTKDKSIIMMSETSLTDSMVANADTYGGWNRVRMSRREDGAAYIYSDKDGKFHNAGGSLISKVTIL